MHLPELSTIHERFLALSQIARERFDDSPGGRLLLRSGFDTDGSSVVMAASVAGAASLCVDAEAERLREGLRAGSIDFVVATLDEALRILKNEVRRARAVSVGLAGDPQSCIAAMMERGLQPDLLSGVSQAEAKVFGEAGAWVLPGEAAPDPETALLAWSAGEDPARTMQRLAELAGASLDPQRADTAARRRWLAQSPRYLGRAFAKRQCLRMGAAEIDHLLPHVQAEFPSTQVTRNGATV